MFISMNPEQLAFGATQVSEKEASEQTELI